GPLVDPEIVDVDPTDALDQPAGDPRSRRDRGQRRIERVEEAVLAVDRLAETALHRRKAGQDQPRLEHDRGGHRRRRERSVVDPIGRRAARGIAVKLALAPADEHLEIAGTVARGEAPAVGAIGRPTAGIGDRVIALRPGGAPAVLEQVEVMRAEPRIANAAEVDPQMAVLVAEQRRKIEVPLAPMVAPAVGEIGGPASPYGGVDRMSRTAEREDVENGRFVDPVPLAFYEALLGRPSHRDQRAFAVHPRPVDAAVEVIRQAPDLRLRRIVAIIIDAGEQDSGEQEHGVDRGQLDIFEAASALHVDEVVEEAAVTGHAGGRVALRRSREEAERVERALTRVGPADPPALGAYRISVERKADRRDRAEALRRPAVRDQAGRRIAHVPEPAKGALLEVVEQAGAARPARSTAGCERPARSQSGKPQGGELDDRPAAFKHGRLLRPP